MGVWKPDAACGESAASRRARNVTCRESRLPRAELRRLAVEAALRGTSAVPPDPPASPEGRPPTRARSGSAGAGPNVVGVDVVVGAAGEVLVEGVAPTERLRFGNLSKPGGSSGAVPGMALQVRYDSSTCTVPEPWRGPLLRYHESKNVQLLSRL